MNGTDLIAILPLIITAATSVVVLLMVAFLPGHRGLSVVTGIGLVAVLLVLPWSAALAPRQVTPLLLVDGYALFFTALISVSGLAISVLAFGYLEGRPPGEPSIRYGNFYPLLLIAIVGGIVLASANHLASLFLGFELLSVALFGLIAYPVEHRRALEAAAKYLILAGASSAFLLFGMALLFAETGTLMFSGPSQAADAGGGYLLFGYALLVVGIGFKLSLVPFHMWTPDVFEGAPAPVGALVSTISKGAVATVLLRFLIDTDAFRNEVVIDLLALAAFASMLVGNLLALLQDNLKRMLAYSSIAHFGYLLVGIVAGGAFAAEVVGYYLVAYFATMIGAFGVITVYSRGSLVDLDQRSDYQGLFYARPWLAGTLTGMLLSLAGIPLTIGFIGKYYALAAGVEAERWWLVGALLVGSAIALFYYLRWVLVLFAPPPEGRPVVAAGVGSSAVLVVLALLLVGLGVYPQPLASLLEMDVARALVP